jgi:hypothetical protein
MKRDEKIKDRKSFQERFPLILIGGSHGIHLQPGLYIAEINDGGYLGQVLYTLKRKA